VVLSTKDRILDAAERLFADSGLRMTSLRDITREAGVNLAAVNYHFGSKEELLKGVLKRAFDPVNDARIVWLDDLEKKAGEDGPKLEDVLQAFIGPPFDAWSQSGERGLRFLKLLGQIHNQANQELQALLLSQFDEVLERYTNALARALPLLESKEVRLRMLFVVGAMAQTLMFGSRPGQETHDLDQMRESLIRFAAVGFSAGPMDRVSEGGGS
jgi:AcrR family transcriptional regulator